MRPSIATRTRLAMVAVALVSLVAAFGVFYAAWSGFTVRQRTSELSRQVVTVAAGLEAADSQPSSAQGRVRDRLFNVQAGLMGAALFVTDEAGSVVDASVETPPESLSLAELERDTRSDVRTGLIRPDTGGAVLVVGAPIGETGRLLVAVQPLREIRAAEAWVPWLGAASLLFAALVAWLAGGLLAAKLTGPLVRLRGAAEDVAAGAWGEQVVVEGDDEVASLATSFNRMSARVADVYEAQRAFVGDVSHELRTPITSIRGFSQALLDGVVTGPAERERALRVIHDESRRMGEMSATLLSLAELDAGTVVVADERVDPAKVADALGDRFGRAARDAGVTLTLALRGEAAPWGDEHRIVQAASALVANAIAYTPSGGEVRVVAEAGDGEWRLAVDDSGPGVPLDKREVIFSRFARLDASRTSSEGGAGLGLAICRRLVELMGGRVWAEDGALGGARFVMCLPLDGVGKAEDA